MDKDTKHPKPAVAGKAAREAATQLAIKKRRKRVAAS